MTEKFDMWCLVELFGHSKMAGRVQEKTIGNAAFLQVDVPETDSNPPFTRLINPSAVYAINPITEEMAREYAKELQIKPIQTWDVREFIQKATQKAIASKAVKEEEYEEETDDVRDSGYGDDGDL